MKRGVDWGKFVFFFSIIFLGLMFYGIQTCKKQMEKGREEIHKAGEKVVSEIEKTGEKIKEAAEQIPKRIIGDLRLNFDNLCTKAKLTVCDGEKEEYCSPDDQVGIEAFLGKRGDKVCCKKDCISEPPSIHAQYPIVYVSGSDVLTCAFQKEEDCKLDKYCLSEQWIKSIDTKTCCKSSCVERVLHRDVFFDGLGYASVERFPDNRFGVWYGAGIGEGFYELGKPDYAEARKRAENRYQFTVDGITYVFDVLQNEPSFIKVNATAVR